MPPPTKLNGVCLWIFEELANYCAWCQYMLPSLFIHTYMSNILIFFITGNNSNFCTFENHIFRRDIISLASHSSVGSRVLNQPVHGVVLAKCSVFLIIFKIQFISMYIHCSSIVAFFCCCVRGTDLDKKHSTSALCM